MKNSARKDRRLMIIVPVAIGLIFVLLYLTFASVKQALLVVGNIPLALVGGIGALWLHGMNLNVSASIGFLALFGVAILNGVLLVSSIEAVLAGARRRLRPVLITAFVASVGFLPMALATSTRSDACK